VWISETLPFAFEYVNRLEETLFSIFAPSHLSGNSTGNPSSFPSLTTSFISSLNFLIQLISLRFDWQLFALCKTLRFLAAILRIPRNHSPGNAAIYDDSRNALQFLRCIDSFESLSLALAFFNRL